MKSIKPLLTLSLFLMVSVLSAQNISALSKSDETIFKALSDEMARGLTGLKIDKFAPPFLIANYMNDGRIFSAKASLGSLIQSNERPVRGQNIRMMVGDYSLNDENFSGGSQGFNSGGANLSLPEENDYAAIRRTFWSMSDRIYKSSIDKYSQKLTALKQQNKNEADKLDDYSRIQPITYLMPAVEVKFDKATWEKRMMDVSAIFKNYPQIQNSSVDVIFISNVQYLSSSEGSKIKYQGNLACFLVNASTQAVDGEILRDQVLYYMPLPEQLPAMEQIRKDVTTMADNLKARCTAPVVEEAYQGPVVFEAEALVELMNCKLFNYSGLFTSREPVYAVTSYSRGSTNKIENKIGKRLCSENISIVSQPKTKTFGNMPLVGSFEIDAEGVVPPDELTLVDKGILKTLLSDRIPTSKVKESNGHNRFSILGGSQKSPDVINTTYTNGNSYADFIQNITAETAKNGLDYFYILRKFETSNPGQQMQQGNSGFPKPIAIYRVMVKTGKEELVRNAVISDFPMLLLKYTLGGTKEQMAFNTLRWQSTPVSYIIPRAIAFNDISIEKDNAPKAKLPVVENPLTVR